MGEGIKADLNILKLHEANNKKYRLFTAIESCCGANINKSADTR